MYIKFHLRLYLLALRALFLPEALCGSASLAAELLSFLVFILDPAVRLADCLLLVVDCASSDRFATYYLLTTYYYLLFAVWRLFSFLLPCPGFAISLDSLLLAFSLKDPISERSESSSRFSTMSGFYLVSLFGDMMAEDRGKLNVFILDTLFLKKAVDRSSLALGLRLKAKKKHLINIFKS